LLEEALQQAEELRDDHQISFTLAALGYRSALQGEYREAAAFSSASVARFQGVGNLASATIVQFSLAVALQQLGETERAAELIQDGLRSSLAYRNRWPLSHGLEATVLLVGDGADAERRARLLGALDALVQSTGARFGTLARVTGESTAGVAPGFHASEQPEQERLEMARRAGRSLPFSEVVTLALAVLHDFSQTLGGSDAITREQVQTNPLSEREQEVLRLVAEGLTSKQIGKQLVLSYRTVDHHLTSIFNKLGVESRAQAVAVAARDRLL
jgi:non-specific serine/threonine protein kinase